MAVFAYSAVNGKTGKKTKGQQEADSPQIAARMLKEQGFREIQVRETGKGAATGPKKTSGGFLFFGKVKLKDKSIFCRQFSTMVNAGVSLVRCLDVLEQQTSNPKLKMITRELRLEVEGGSTLSKAMSNHPAAFDNLFLGLVKSGEIGGALDETLERLAVFLEKDMELRRKVKSAMTYPVIVMFAATGIVGFLVYFILPQFAKMFKDMNVKDMPATTEFLIETSDFVRYHTLMTIGIVACCYGAFRA
ncbi:MAG: type II secretion system F family protein, partial [Chloroflexi bacterium]|nr:type II secretion system F family protein [Chloroflexota bacterium]